MEGEKEGEAEEAGGGSHHEEELSMEGKEGHLKILNLPFRHCH